EEIIDHLIGNFPGVGIIPSTAQIDLRRRVKTSHLPGLTSCHKSHQCDKGDCPHVSCLHRVATKNPAGLHQGSQARSFRAPITSLGSDAEKTKLPATSTSAPASSSAGALLRLTPPSISISAAVPDVRISADRRVVVWRRTQRRCDRYLYRRPALNTG